MKNNKLMVIFCTIFLCSLSLWPVERREVTSKSVLLARSEHSRKGKVLDKIKPGQILEIIGNGGPETIDGVSGDWLRIKISGGADGFVFGGFTRQLTVISQPAIISKILNQYVGKAEPYAYPEGVDACCGKPPILSIQNEYIYETANGGESDSYCIVSELVEIKKEKKYLIICSEKDIGGIPWLAEKNKTNKSLHGSNIQNKREITLENLSKKQFRLNSYSSWKVIDPAPTPLFKP